MNTPGDVRRLLVRCALLGVVAALPVAFNAWIDPARILGAASDERAIAAALLSGKNVTNFTNYDQRRIEKQLAAGRAWSPDVLVLGSSRIMTLSADAFRGSRFVNAAVEAARLDDILGTYALYDDPSRRPKRVIVNLDPWTLQNPGTDVTWGSLARERAATLDRLGMPTSLLRDRFDLSIAAFKRLASPEYFRLSVFSLRHHGVGGIRYVATDQRVNAEKTKTPDGALVWRATSPEQTEGTVSAYLATVASDTRYQDLGSDTEKERVETLEHFARYVVRNGVELTFVLAPYHPRVYGEFQKRPDRPLEWTETRYRALAERVGAQVIGSYDPTKAGMTASDFYDEAHVRSEAFVRLFTR